MNVLVISNAAWDDKNSSGNTYSNLLEGWEDTIFHSMYSREEAPNNRICSSYCCVSPFDIIKNLFTPWRIGKFFDQEELSSAAFSQKAESNVKEVVKGKKIQFLYLLIDLLYLSKWWFNSSIKRYIQECNPDVIVMTGVSEAYRYTLAKYLKSHTRAKLVTYIVDDTYHTEKDSHTLLGIIRSRRYKKIFELSDRVYGISQEMCDAYSDEFGKEVKLLQKGCDISPYKSYVNNPIEIVYAGNLFYGRDCTLIEIAESIKKINTESVKAVLNIYTGSIITDEINKKLNDGVNSKILGSKPYEEIKQIMRTADVVLHVESFDPKQIALVRYSFSTKITDCLQSGSVLMAIGPRETASIAYSKRIDGAFVIDDTSKLTATLSNICDNPQLLIQRAKATNTFAREYHDISKTRKQLENDFKRLIQQEQ